MKKNKMAMLLAGVMALSMTACGNSGSTTATTASATSAASAAESGAQAAPAPAAGARELRLSTPVPEGTDTYNQAVAVKEYIEEHTNGELTVTIFPANQLGDWTQVFDELMMGSIDMAISNAPETYDPVVGVNSLSYLVYDYDSCREIFSADSFLVDKVGEALNKLGVQFFGFSVSGFDGVGTNKEIKNPTAIGEDKGCLIRVPSLDGVKYPLEHLGFRTSSIPYTDTYSSIQTGVVDGWIGAPPYQHYLGFRDVEKYYYAYNSLPEIMDAMMSKMVYDSLTPEQQKVVTEAMELACSMSIDDAEKGDEEYMKKLEESGISVVRFEREELETFANSIRENVWPKFDDFYGKEFMDQLRESIK